MARIVPITVGMLPGYTGLDGGNADNYYRAGQRDAFLASEVVRPFDAALKDGTGYSDENIPDKEIEVASDIGDLSFAVQVTPTTKRPGYKDVFDELDGYLRARLADYKAGNRPVGVLTIDDEPYISANEVLDRLGKARKKVIARGVSMKVSNPELPAAPQSVVVPLGMDMAELNEGNARRYLEALALSERYAEIIKGFEGDLLGMTGFGKDNPPGQTEHMYTQMGVHVFHIATVPYQSISYGKVIDGLDNEPGKKPETGGDLVLVAAGIEIPRLRAYDARKRDGDALVSLKGLVRRMEKLVEENTEAKVRQKPIGHYPIV